ncbi:Nitrogen fixation protein Nif U [Mycoplasmopsis agalactiae 14628]|uniref:Nitrogen fixation protein Nif U n=1 Tax=Mycoplasmopsis agalactiae 14628 TaxID=1110504 RepID=I5D5E0_MYCAA|nr:iron-sulfur cluster assembly scaffold protein [Mycoplasmopsis agalactiae]EIN14899.1 Nitrogen fixation protein Nif U [Mycoplasmopsis agalactiae 14628]
MNNYLQPSFKKEVQNKKIESFSNSCGDYLEADYIVENGIIKNLHFNGNGCAYFISSANLLCKYLNDKNIAESLYFIDLFERNISGKFLSDEEKTLLGELLVFDNVNQHANRLDCVQMLSKPLKEKIKNEQ